MGSRRGKAMKLRSKLLNGVVALAALSAGAEVASYAQTAPAGPAAPAVNNSPIGDIVVTARKREESLQDIPVAVSAFTGDSLESRGVDTAADLANIVPSLHAASSNQSYSNGIAFTLRGQAAGADTLNAAQAVGLYVDGVNIPHVVGTDGALFDIQRVEVLKGPQGTLYGRNTTGGAINIITRGADFDGIHGFGQVELGNYDSLKYAGAINLPIVSDVLSARFAYQHWDREGYLRSVYTGQDMGGDHNDSIYRLSLRFEPASNFSGEFKLERAELDRNYAAITSRQINDLLGPTSIPAAEAIAAGYTPWTPNDDFFINGATNRNRDEVESWHSALTLNWDITDNIRLTSVTGYHDFENFKTFNLFGLPGQVNVVGVGSDFYAPTDIASIPGPDYPYTPLSVPDQAAETLSQEFNLSGTAFDDRLDWLLGAYWSRDEGHGGQPFVAAPNINILSGFEPTVGGTITNKITNETWGVFTQNDIKLTDMISLTLGARYSEEKIDQNLTRFAYSLDPADWADGTGVACISGPAASFLPDDSSGVDVGSDPDNNYIYDDIHDCDFSQEGIKSNGISYLASLNFQLTDDVLLYFKTARGFRGGGLQIRAPDAPGVSPEFAEDIEIGFKGDFLDGRLRTNLAIFQTDYTNKQETVIIELAGTSATALVNAASATIQGVEMDIQAEPVDGWSIYMTASYLDGVYDHYPEALTTSAVVTSSGCVSGCVDGSGVRFGQVPEWLASIGSRYETAVGPGVLGFQADYNWRGDIPLTILTEYPAFSRELQEELNEQRGILNARIDYKLEDAGLTFALFSTNVTDENYQLPGGVIINELGIASGVTAEPRMYGVSLRKTFGAE